MRVTYNQEYDRRVRMAEDREDAALVLRELVAFRSFGFNHRVSRHVEDDRLTATAVQ